MSLKSMYNKAKAAAPVAPLVNKIPAALNPNKPLDIVVGNANKVTQRLGKAGADIGSGWDDIRHGRPIGTSAQEQDRMNRAGEETAGIKAANKQTEMLAALPQLQDRQNLDSLGAAGQFKASTVANPENSPWQQMAMKQQGINQGMAGDALAKNNAIAAAQGRATVAGGRGPSSGGMERAGQANMQSLAAGRQGLNATGGQQRQAIAQQAGAKGLATAQFNTGQMNQAEQANIGAQRADNQQQNAFNQLKYGEQMKYKSGQLSGDAISKSGGKK